MNKFEYKIEKIENKLLMKEEERFFNIKKQLNIFGNEGWELVFFDGSAAIFKRKICS